MCRRIAHASCARATLTSTALGRYSALTVPAPSARYSTSAASAVALSHSGPVTTPSSGTKSPTFSSQHIARAWRITPSPPRLNNELGTVVGQRIPRRRHPARHLVACPLDFAAARPEVLVHVASRRLHLKRQRSGRRARVPLMPHVQRVTNVRLPNANLHRHDYLPCTPTGQPLFGLGGCCVTRPAPSGRCLVHAPATPFRCTCRALCYASVPYGSTGQDERRP